MIRDAAAEAMLPRFEAALSAGQRVYFGPVGIDTWGLHLQGAIPWSAIESIRWESEGSVARHVVFAMNGARLAEIGCPVPNEVILRVVLGRLGKLGDARQEGSPLGDEIIAAARRLLARYPLRCSTRPRAHATELRAAGPCCVRQPRGRP